jgi:hypothetical protein
MCVNACVGDSCVWGTPVWTMDFNVWTHVCTVTRIMYIGF